MLKTKKAKIALFGGLGVVAVALVRWGFDF